MTGRTIGSINYDNKKQLNFKYITIVMIIIIIIIIIIQFLFICVLIQQPQGELQTEHQ
jgi:heme/copper-type cytochrome/quinol oxidase subunit 2